MSDANTNETRLHTYQSSLTPIYQPESKQYFCEFTQPTKIEVDGAAFETNYLKPDVQFSLLGLSQSISLLESGLLDVTDAIDPDMSLAEIAITFKHNGEDHVWYHKLETPESADPLGAFTYSPQGGYHVLQLNYAGVIVMTSKANVTNSIGVNGFGTCNLELGNTKLNFKITNREDADFTDVRVVGYKLKAKRVNYNRRPA